MAVLILDRFVKSYPDYPTDKNLREFPSRMNENFVSSNYSCHKRKNILLSKIYFIFQTLRMDNYLGLPILVTSIEGGKNEGILKSINLKDQSIQLQTKSGLIELKATQISDLEVIDESDER